MAAFKDFNVKLAVIEVLLYQRELLAPAFDLDARMRERGIGMPAVYVLENDLDDEVLDESRAFFEDLVIGDELLAEVETLCFDAGVLVAPGKGDTFAARGIEAS